MSRIGDFLLEKMLASECKRAGLVESSVQLSFGHIDYLQSRNGSDLSEAIVLLHGATSDKTSWVRFARHLDSRLPLVIPDLPGHGKSVAEIDLDYSIGAQTEYLKELLDRLGIKRVHLIGNSMGGAIAIRLASISPGLVASLVLIDTAGVEVTQSWLRQHAAQTGLNPMIEVQDAKGYRAMMSIGMESPPYIPQFLLSSLARAFAGRKAINRKITEDIERDLDQTGNLEKIAVPSLIIWGEADKVEHVDNAEFLHQRLPDSRKIVMEGVGHVPMVEAPKQTAAACNTFFAGVVNPHA